MQRRNFLRATGAGLALFAIGRSSAGAADAQAGRDFEQLHKSAEQWRKLLEPAQFAIMFEDGTEPAFSSPLNDETRAGTYLCAACYLPLFLSQTKFKSGTGWPSFYRAIDGRTGTSRDWKLLIPRTEYHCARCKAHQGHIFNDGPEPTGERWCNNGLALRFVPAAEALPALRT